MTTASDRRRFSRIPFDAWVELQQQPQRWHAPVVDLSLRGLLVQQPADWQPDPYRGFLAAVRLAGAAVIHMEVRLRHGADGMLGFVCDRIDLESASQLRRLVELNLGDADILERELGALGAPED